MLKELFQRIMRKLDKIKNLPNNINEITSIDQGMQILLSLKYREMLYQGIPLPKFEEIEFRASSPDGGAGILFYIFALIGTTNKKVVEICAGNGIISGSANLIINHGWTALLFEGNEEHIKKGRAFYAASQDTHIWPPTFVHAWITAENIDSLITQNGFVGDIDLLIMNMEGVDYWTWKAIDSINPRVVAVIYQDIWGPDKAVTVPYKPDFTLDPELGHDYCGASLAAFVKLAREKKYRLVGCEHHGFIAYFIRSDVGEDVFPEIQPSECFKHPKVQLGIENRLPRVIGHEWVEV